MCLCVCVFVCGGGVGGGVEEWNVRMSTYRLVYPFVSVQLYGKYSQSLKKLKSTGYVKQLLKCI